MAKYIPDTFFKGVQNSTDECPLAFITPDGTDKAAEKRIATVKEWVNGYYSKNKNPAFETIDNPPLTGFKLTKEIKRWMTSNVVWRIIDPRGFQLEISSGNLAYIMANTIINHGTIEAELQWCRNGSQNFLLPTNSEEYKTYIEITNAKKNNLGIKDITVGDTIITGTDTIGMYLGGYYTLEYGSVNKHLINSTRRYYIKKDNGSVISRTSLKNIRVVKKGDEEDNKDWTDYISKHIEKTYYNQEPFIKISTKKFNVKEIAKTLRFVVVDFPKNKRHYFIKKNNDYYKVDTFYSGNQEIKVILKPDENTLEYDYNNKNIITNIFWKDIVSIVELMFTVDGEDIIYGGM